MSGFPPGQTYTIEQIELLRRLRNSGITKQQVIQAFDSFERIDQELGQLYTVPLPLMQGIYMNGLSQAQPVTNSMNMNNVNSLTSTVPTAGMVRSRGGNPMAGHKRTHDEVADDNEDCESTASSNNEETAGIDEEVEFQRDMATKSCDVMYDEVKTFVGRHSIKQAQIASMTGVSQSYVSRYLRGEYAEMSDRCRKAIYVWYLSYKRKIAAGHTPVMTLGSSANGFMSPNKKFVVLTEDSPFIPKRERFTFREKHLEVLESYFHTNPYPSMDLRDEIAHKCNVATGQDRLLCDLKEKVNSQIVLNWFNNRRKEIKRLAREEGIDYSGVALQNQMKSSNYGERVSVDSRDGQEDETALAMEAAAVNRAILALSGNTTLDPIVVKQEPKETNEKS